MMGIHDRRIGRLAALVIFLAAITLIAGGVAIIVESGLGTMTFRSEVKHE